MTTFFSLSDLGLVTSSTQLLAQWLAYMQSTYPGYTPSSGNLEYVMALIFATWAADLSAQASQGADDLFQAFGTQLLDLPVHNGDQATATLQVTSVDNAGYTLPAGTQFILDGTTGFSSFADVSITSGMSQATFSVQAISPGEAGNGAGAVSVQINQQLSWVSGVSVVSVSSGGEDSETQESYLNRLASTLQLLAPRPITASDYSQFVLNFPAGNPGDELVGRATAIDGYNPNNSTFNNERCVGVCVTDSSGQALNAQTIADITAYLESVRELNFIVNVFSPAYSPVYVTSSVTIQPSYDPGSVKSSISSALTNLLQPATWGTPPNAGGAGQTTSTWFNYPVVYRSVIESVIQQVAGVVSVVNGSTLLGLSSGSLSPNDLVLPGAVPLPTTSNGATVPPSAFSVV